eukprot:NODE_4464_length_783_cov_40.184451_g4305_i0.p1 GENE.NODE_4464_length_783_cov_40.184451_g4305_i0~~NODE_4464_length_783_cov_40.184451_g4305_i0.p1  ORF type:complete len:238 (+),score=52.09 NODE_4464_length_783_cov_40.184451_g4305_i0:54-716(+)
MASLAKNASKRHKMKKEQTASVTEDTSPTTTGPSQALVEVDPPNSKPQTTPSDGTPTPVSNIPGTSADADPSKSNSKKKKRKRSKDPNAPATPFLVCEHCREDHPSVNCRKIRNRCLNCHATDHPSRKCTAPPDGRRVFLKGLVTRVDVEEVAALFPDEKVIDFVLVFRGGKFKGSGFITFETIDGAKRALARKGVKVGASRCTLSAPKIAPPPCKNVRY